MNPQKLMGSKSHHFALAIVNSSSGKEWEGSSLVHKCIVFFTVSTSESTDGK